MNRETVIREVNDKVELINEALDKYLPGLHENPELIHKSMRYSIHAGGKRLRPVLVLASAEAVGGDFLKTLPAACALELIHTYSLIHDDLPAMDNDDYRRGKLTNHKVFGESMAILAGDALLTLAFELITRSVEKNVPPDVIVNVIREIAAAAGSRGMIGGQVVDILSEDKTIDKDLLKYIHDHKTGALFKASIRTGAMMGGADQKRLSDLTDYAEYMGIAFQITDDILDVEGDSQTMGKTVGSDQRKKKSTYPSLYGLGESKRLAAEAVEKALYALADFDTKADTLRYIASSLINRDR